MKSSQMWEICLTPSAIPRPTRSVSALASTSAVRHVLTDAVLKQQEINTSIIVLQQQLEDVCNGLREKPIIEITC